MNKKNKFLSIIDRTIKYNDLIDKSIENILLRDKYKFDLCISIYNKDMIEFEKIIINNKDLIYKRDFYNTNYNDNLQHNNNNEIVIVEIMVFKFIIKKEDIIDFEELNKESDLNEK